jgi:ferritin-like protein
MTQSAGFHEDATVLKVETRYRHRAIASIMEELEAVDWYDQRVDATQDEELRAILAHNRDEEKEHAAMVLEWLRRRDPALDEQLRAYLFTDKSIVEREHEADAAEAFGSSVDGSLAIGSLREEGLR